MTSLTPNQQRAAIEEAFLLAFSGKAVAFHELQTAITQLSDMAGIYSFLTPLPWKLFLPAERVASGHSLNLASATQDILAQLNLLQSTLPTDAPVALCIDKAGLEKNRQALSLPSLTITGA